MALYIILSVLAFFVLLLVLPIRIYAFYNGKVGVYLSVLGIRFSIYPRKKKFGQRKKGSKRKKSASTKAPATAEKGKEKGFSDHINNLRLFLRILKRIEKRLRRAFKITVLEMRATVATGDAASTAILYGIVSQGFSYILAIANNFVRMGHSAKNIGVIPDYTGEKSSFRIKIRLSSSLFYLLGAGIHTAFAFLKEKTNLKNTVQTEDQENG